MKTLLTILCCSAIFVLISPCYVSADDEITLFDSRGKATAYIALDDELTIYLWSGKPVAYLKKDTSGGFHVYGFNGKHLGWFVKSVIWDHEGNGSCALKESLRSTEYEPFKSFKQFKPFKSFQEFAPFRPKIFLISFSIICRNLLLHIRGLRKVTWQLSS